MREDRESPRGESVECKMCETRCVLSVEDGEVKGANCPRGREFAQLTGLLDED